MDLMLILSRLFNIQGMYTTSMISFKSQNRADKQNHPNKQTFNVGFYSKIYKSISFKVGRVLETY